jgi:hypothetical protein
VSRKNRKNQAAKSKESNKAKNTEPEDHQPVRVADEINRLTEAYKTNHKDDHQHAQKHLFWNRWTASFTALAFLAAAIYALISFKQWHDSGKNFTIDQRPWAGISSISADFRPYSRPDGDGGRFDGISVRSLSIEIQNSGKTPARELSVMCCTFSERPGWQPIPANNAMNQKEFGKGGTIAPGVKRSIEIVHDMALAGYAGYNVYVMGRLTYSDIFPNSPRRTTEFCLMYSINTSGQQGKEFVFCPEGNRMD